MREREDLVLCEALGNYPQMHVLFSHTKLWMIAMGLSKELWLPSKIFFGTDLVMECVGGENDTRPECT